MILAAGRGERLRPLTDRCPKPLIKLAGHSLIEHHLRRLQRVGVTRCVINLAHLGHLIAEQVGDGTRLGMSIHYSVEPPGALETAGGIRFALPLLDDAPFWVLNGDVFSDFQLDALAMPANSSAHLVLINNPAHHPRGDFSLIGARVGNRVTPRFTYSGIAVFTPRLFARLRRHQRFPLAPLLREASEKNVVTAQLHRGRWFDIGTFTRLHEARHELSNS